MVSCQTSSRSCCQRRQKKSQLASRLNFYLNRLEKLNPRPFSRPSNKIKSKAFPLLYLILSLSDEYFITHLNSIGHLCRIKIHFTSKYFKISCFFLESEYFSCLVLCSFSWTIEKSFKKPIPYRNLHIQTVLLSTFMQDPILS